MATGELPPPPTSFVNPGFDLFYVDLGSAAYRAGGLRASTIELTRAGNNADSRALSPIDTVSMTRDGHYLGITSSRVVFAGTALTPLGTFRQNSDAEEGYVIDMATRTIDRVVTNANGGDADGSIHGPLSLSADAGLVSFLSDADNLIFGDANGVADAFVADRTPVNHKPPPRTTTPTTTFTITNPPAPPGISASAKRRNDTSVNLTVHVPGAGGIAAIARRHGHGAPVIARAFATARRRGSIRVTLSLLAKYAAAVRRGNCSTPMSRSPGRRRIAGRRRHRSVSPSSARPRNTARPGECEWRVFTLLPRVVGIGETSWQAVCHPSYIRVAGVHSRRKDGHTLMLRFSGGRLLGLRSGLAIAITAAALSMAPSAAQAAFTLQPCHGSATAGRGATFPALLHNGGFWGSGFDSAAGCSGSPAHPSYNSAPVDTPGASANGSGGGVGACGGMQPAGPPATAISTSASARPMIPVLSSQLTTMDAG